MTADNGCPLPYMGVKIMTEQSENKATPTDTSDESKQPSAAPTKPAKDELGETNLEKVVGGGTTAATYVGPGHKNVHS
jgi:hypothetical protein